MKKRDYKSCNRKKCVYYGYKICPHRKECDYSKDVVWKEKK